MSKSIKANSSSANPIDVFFSQKQLGFEILSDSGNYQILVNTETSNVKVQLPHGEIIDRDIEDYFNEDLIEDEEFELFLKSLLMSVEFFNSDVWVRK